MRHQLLLLNIIFMFLPLCGYGQENRSQLDRLTQQADRFFQEERYAESLTTTCWRN